MLWTRAIIFSVLVPGCLAVLIPVWLTNFGAPMVGWWRLGWLLFYLGVAIYVRCLRNFVRAGGTPAIFFTRPLRTVLGSEPPRTVQGDIYRLSRNPMYLAVVCTVAGEAIAFASASVALYCILLFVAFHLVVRLIEEPHLRARDDANYERYCRQVPRWIWFPASSKQGSSVSLESRKHS